VDPVCHTLVGAALAETGLKRRTPAATATLLIGANLPDLDMLSYAWGSLAALSFRRGWTHGVLAMAVLPLMLATAVVWVRRLWTRKRGGEPAAFQQVALLSYVAVLTHPILDTLNTYGMRWLMPFRDRWFYGDALFIVDPWVWGVLAGGVLLARRHGTGRPARWALGLGAAYAVAMWFGSLIAGRDACSQLADTPGNGGGILVSPVPVNSFTRLVVIDEGDRYRFGWYRWLGHPRLAWEGDVVVKNGDDPAARAAAATAEGAMFLQWARFPFFLTEHGRGETLVHIVDARYTLDPEATFGAFTVRVAATGDDGR
jgi:inner membrane protein